MDVTVNKSDNSFADTAVPGELESAETTVKLTPPELKLQVTGPALGPRHPAGLIMGPAPTWKLIWRLAFAAGAKANSINAAIRHTRLFI